MDLMREAREARAMFEAMDATARSRAMAVGRFAQTDVLRFPHLADVPPGLMRAIEGRDGDQTDEDDQVERARDAAREQG